MKKYCILSILLVLVACTQKEIAPREGVLPPVVYASTESDNATKTVLETDDEGVGSIYWLPEDRINVFYNTTSVQYVSSNTEKAGTTPFNAVEEVAQADLKTTNIWGLYPFDEDATCNGSAIVTTIPSTQYGVPGTFDDDSFVAIARSDGQKLSFKNVCGGIKFSLTRDDYSSISFRGNNDEYIAGIVSVSFVDGIPQATIVEGVKEVTIVPKEGTTFAADENYYIELLPVTLENGFTMTFVAGGETGTLVINSPKTIKRSVFGKKADIDNYAEFETGPCLTFASTGKSSIALRKSGSPENVSLNYKVDNGRWTPYVIDEYIDVEDGHTLSFVAASENTSFSSNSSNHYYFRNNGTGKLSVSGNIMSLLDPTSQLTTLPSSGVFFELFESMLSLTDAVGLILPASVLTENCYTGMFSGCSYLTSAPALPARSLAPYCYMNMFNNCSRLETAPELPATKMTLGCYWMMFKWCNSLQTAPALPATELANSCYKQMFAYSGIVNAPVLPATTLAEACYYGMFGYCEDLAVAPVLPAKTLVKECYRVMFAGCSSLSSVSAYFDEIPEGGNATTYWLSDVSATGTLVKAATATWDETGVNGVPEGWSVERIGVTFDEPVVYVPVDETAQLTANVYTTSANRSVAWSSSNSTVASVSSTGLVTAKQKGTATITCTMNDGGFSATCEVVVINSSVNLSASATANSYLVQEAGVYKIKTVKGNTTTSVGPVANAEVLWETFGTTVCPNVGDLVRDITYENNFITFTTTGRNGNAVIVAKASNDQILWSWHIWCSDEGYVEQVYANNGGTMMDRNLGATSATPGNVGALGLYYQWGRKDPFPGAGDINCSVNAAYTLGDIPVLSTMSNAIGSDNTTLAYSIMHPSEFIYHESDWFATSFTYSNDNLWGPDTKTEYDPCPAGWRVPSGRESGPYYAITGDLPTQSNGTVVASSYVTVDTSHKGLLFPASMCGSEAWFPITGGRRSSMASLNYGDYGILWTSNGIKTNGSNSEISIGFYFTAKNDYFCWYGEWAKSEAYPVRCVKE